MDAKTGANIKTGKFVVGDRETTFPIYDVLAVLGKSESLGRLQDQAGPSTASR